MSSSRHSWATRTPSPPGAKTGWHSDASCEGTEELGQEQEKDMPGLCAAKQLDRQPKKVGVLCPHVWQNTRREQKQLVGRSCYFFPAITSNSFSWSRNTRNCWKPWLRLHQHPPLPQPSPPDELRGRMNLKRHIMKKPDNLKLTKAHTKTIQGPGVICKRPKKYEFVSSVLWFWCHLDTRIPTISRQCACSWAHGTSLTTSKTS